MVKVTLLGSTRSVACVGLATFTANRFFATSWGFALPRQAADISQLSLAPDGANNSGAAKSSAGGR